MIFILKLFAYPVLLYYGIKWLWRSWILYKARDPKSKYSHLPIPPGDFGLPLVGETYLWALQGSKFNFIRRKKYGKAFSTNFIGLTMVKVTGPEYIKTVLTRPHDELATVFPTTVREILGENTISNSFHSAHKYKRRLFLRAFTANALNNYMPVLQKQISETMDKWKYNEEKFVYDFTRQITFKTAQMALIGIETKNAQEQKDLFELFDKLVNNMFTLPLKYPSSPFNKGLHAREALHKILLKHISIIRLRQKEDLENMRENNLTKAPERRGFVSGLQLIMDAECESKIRHENNDDTTNKEYELTDISMLETVVELIFAGYLTTSSSTTLAIKHLIEHKDVFVKLEKELIDNGLIINSTNEKNFENHNNNNANVQQCTESLQPHTDRKSCTEYNLLANNITEANLRHRKLNPNGINNTASFDVSHKNCDCLKTENVDLKFLNSLTYLNQIVKETLRSTPPILGAYRKTLKTIKLGKYRVPKGWTIIFNIRDTHESEWNDDPKFNPDNFAEENWKECRENRYRYLPFGGGDRLCIGKEFAQIQMKLMLIQLMRRYKKWEFGNGKPPTLCAIPMLYPKDGMPIKLTPR